MCRLTRGRLLATLPCVRVTAKACVALLASSLAIECAHVGAERHESKHKALTSAERLAIIRRAQVWKRTEVSAIDIRTGPTGPEAFPPGATVTCDYLEEALGGSTPKFGCALSKDDHLKVRYGRNNGEVYASVAATRLLWALGFGADAVYPVHIVCRGCPTALQTEGSAEGQNALRFDIAAIERKMPGRELKSAAGSGWAWPELDIVDESAGGAPLAHRDALKLLAAFLQHSDNKADQQKLLCLDDRKVDHELCTAPFMMIHDVGQTFGHSNLFNRKSVGSVNFEQWAGTPMWRDPQHCFANLGQSQTGTLSDPHISESGRKFLLDELMELTDRQLTDLFTVARFAEKPGGSPVEAWVGAFKKKRNEIAAVSCR